MYNGVEERINMVMAKCFKKVKTKQQGELTSSYMVKYKTITSFAKKGKIQRRVAKKLHPFDP